LNELAIDLRPLNNPHHGARIEDHFFRVWNELLIEKSVTCETFQSLPITDVLGSIMSLMIHICPLRNKGWCDMRRETLIVRDSLFTTTTDSRAFISRVEGLLLNFLVVRILSVA
jgi:hypothetical protein